VVSSFHVWPRAQACIAVGGSLVSAGSISAQPESTNNTAGPINNALERLLEIINPPEVLNTHKILRGHNDKSAQRRLRPPEFVQLLIVNAVVVGNFMHQSDVDLLFQLIQ
jgi:hypothetical protein